jgi:hypothetical protein
MDFQPAACAHPRFQRLCCVDTKFGSSLKMLSQELRGINDFITNTDSFKDAGKATRSVHGCVGMARCFDGCGCTTWHKGQRRRRNINYQPSNIPSGIAPIALADIIG